MNKGLNNKNLEYWRDKVYIELHELPEKEAILKAQIICLEQEADMLKDRIIKLEKKFNILT